MTAPRVRTTAATAAATGPAVPTARASRLASGTSVPAAGPSTAIVATARARYSTAVTANAVPMTRGSWRSGSRNRVVSGATASQPTNDSIRVAAARPIALHPCGANGAQWLARAPGAEPVTAITMITISSATSTSWAVLLARTPPRARASTTSSSTAATAQRASGPPPVTPVT